MENLQLLMNNMNVDTKKELWKKLQNGPITLWELGTVVSDLLAT